MLLSAENLTHAIGTRRLFNGLSLRLDRGERVGFVGDNGTGKTTLIRCLTKEFEPDDGRISVARGVSIGHLKQDPDFPAGQSVIDVAEGAFAELHDLAGQLRVLEHDMSGDDADAAMKKYEKVSHAFEEAGGYAWRHKLEAALDGVGLERSTWNRDVDQLSGGQRSRLQLARLLVDAPDVLLLDEPTNHLDLAAIEWLENELGRFTGAALIISHDRFLLDRLATRIDHLERGSIKSYPGNYAAFLKQAEADELARGRAFEKQQKDIDKQAEYVRRFKAGQRARQAKGREKRLNRLLGSDELVADATKKSSMHLSFVTDAVKSDRILKVSGLKKSFSGQPPLWQGIGFEVAPGDRIGIVGPNGCGKTTLLRCLVGDADADAGEVRWGPKLSLGYYDQRLEDFEPENTVLDELYPDAVEAGLSEHGLRDALGAMHYSGNDVHKPMAALSGGERARVALTRLLLKKANVLVLDEPTNHLDVASREALERALRGYDGTIISVSHDRWFLDRVADRLVVFEPPQIVDFRGGWQSWLEHRAAAKEAPQQAASLKPKASAMPSKKKDPAKNKFLRPYGSMATPKLEERITHVEITLSELQEDFATGVGMSDPAAAREKTAELERLTTELSQLEEEYFNRADA